MAQDSGLPPVRRSRPHSSAEKGAWNRVLNNQRKIGLSPRPVAVSGSGSNCPSNKRLPERKNASSNDPSNCSLNGFGVKRLDKLCPGLARSMKNDTILELIKSKDNHEQQPLTSSPEIIKVKEDVIQQLTSACYNSDDPFILEGSLLLEKISQLQEEKCKEKSVTCKKLSLDNCKLKLQKLLLEKVKSIIEHDCLILSRDGFDYARELESMYTEDKYKLTTAQSYQQLSENQKRVAIEDFVLTAQRRRLLPGESEERINSWLNNLTNSRRLLNISYKLPKERLCQMLIEKTAQNLHQVRLSIAHWLTLILQTNIKIMTIYWNNLPFECLCNLLYACLSFNQIFPEHRFDPIGIVADVHARYSASRISFLLHNEAKKIISAKRRSEHASNSISPETSRNDEKGIDCGLGVSQSPESDYFTASSSDLSKDGSSASSPSGDKIDLVNYLQIVASSGQRIVMKLSFAAQHVIASFRQAQTTNNGPKIHNRKQESSILPSPTSRQLWSKIDEQESLTQKRIFYSFDLVFWPKFWKNFGQRLFFNITYLNHNFTSSPIALCPVQFQCLVHDSLRQSLHASDLSNIAAEKLREVANIVLFEITSQTWINAYSACNIKIKDMNRSVHVQDDRLDEEAMVQAISGLILFLQQDGIDGHKVCRLVACKQLELALMVVEKSINWLAKKKLPQALIKFYQQVQTLGSMLASLKLGKDESGGNLVESLVSLSKVLIEKICMNIHETAFTMLARGVLAGGKEVKSFQKEAVIKDVQTQVLEPCIESLDSSDSQNLAKLESSLSGAFSAALHKFLLHPRSKKLHRHDRIQLIGQVREFVVQQEYKFHGSSMPQELRALSQWIKSSGDDSSVCSALRSNRVRPLFQEWPARTSHSPLVGECGLC